MSSEKIIRRVTEKTLIRCPHCNVLYEPDSSDVVRLHEEGHRLEVNAVNGDKEYIDKDALIQHLTKQMLCYDGSKFNLRKGLYWNVASVLDAIRAFAPANIPVSSEVQDE